MKLQLSISQKQLTIKTYCFERKKKCFPILNEKLLEEGLLRANTPFMFTNEVFYNVCNEWEKLNIKWETIAFFIKDALNCAQKVLFQSLAPRSVAIKNKFKICQKVKRQKYGQNMKTIF